LLLERLVTLKCALIELFLQVSSGDGYGRFASLGPSPVLPFLTAFTTSLHVVPGRSTTMLNPRQMLAFAPWQDVRFGS
jgi:hypothetical protein